MLKSAILIIPSLLFSLIVSAQSIVSSGGAFHSNAQGSISWTLGEPVTGLLSNTESLSQGFQQSNLPSNLPIELLSFEVVNMENQYALLSWKTLTEINNDYFTVEKSQDGRLFHPIGRVDGQGNSTFIQQYSYKDPNPFLGVSYYRIKQTDLDGAFSYTEVRSIVFGNELRGTVFPNPATDRLFVSGFEAGIISITNSVGQEIYRKEFHLSNEPLLELNVSHFTPGVYMISLLGSLGDINKLKFIKTK